MIPDGKEFYSLTIEDNKILVYKGPTFGTEDEFLDNHFIMTKQEVIEKWKDTKYIETITASDNNSMSHLMYEYEYKIENNNHLIP